MGCPNSFEYRRTELQELGVITPGDLEQQQGEKIADSYLGKVSAVEYNFYAPSQNALCTVLCCAILC
jgi:hypothetical protein